MKRFFAALVVTVFMTLNIFAAPEVADQTLAIVNGEPIFMSEFNKFLEQCKQFLPTNEQTEQKFKQIKDIFLDRKIQAILLEQEMKKQKITASKKEIQDTVNEFKKNFKNEAEFNSFITDLKKQGVDIEKSFTTACQTNKLIKKVTKPKKLTESDVKAFYDKIVIKMKSNSKDISNEEDLFLTDIANQLKKISDEQVRIRHIFISCPKNAKEEKVKETQKKIETIKKELRTQNFADIAKRYSENSTSKSRSGNLETIAKSDTQFPNINKIAFSLKVGDYTKEPVQTDEGYHFIRVEEKRAAQKLTFDNIKNNIFKLLEDYNSLKAISNYIKDLKAKANIKINK
jgi:parvulin-like peptidyl-prolyl isomerase